MNSLTFVIALLYEKGLLTDKEAKALHKVAVEQTLNNNLRQMQERIRAAIDPDTSDTPISVTTVDARDLLK